MLRILTGTYVHFTTMRIVLCLIALTVYVNGQTFELPHGHALTDLVDQGFIILDKDHNGVLTKDELAIYVDLEDANHDGYTTLAEYMAFDQTPLEVAQPIFNAYDHDHDGRLPDNFMQEYFHLIDQNGDGQSTKQEYEHYQTSFLQCVFGHGSHGHGADCSSR